MLIWEDTKLFERHRVNWQKSYYQMLKRKTHEKVTKREWKYTEAILTNVKIRSHTEMHKFIWKFTNTVLTIAKLVKI